MHLPSFCCRHLSTETTEATGKVSIFLSGLWGNHWTLVIWLSTFSCPRLIFHPPPQFQCFAMAGWGKYILSLSGKATVKYCCHTQLKMLIYPLNAVNAFCDASANNGWISPNIRKTIKNSYPNYLNKIKSHSMKIQFSLYLQAIYKHRTKKKNLHLVLKVRTKFNIIWQWLNHKFPNTLNTDNNSYNSDCFCSLGTHTGCLLYP